MKKVIICLGVILSFIACQTGNIEEDIVTKNRMNSALNAEDSLPPIVDYIDNIDTDPKTIITREEIQKYSWIY